MFESNYPLLDPIDLYYVKCIETSHNFNYANDLILQSLKRFLIKKNLDNDCELKICQLSQIQVGLILVR